MANDGRFAYTGLDRYDQAILEVMAADARVTVTELGKRVGLTKTPTQQRLKRLEESGYIQGYRAVLNPARLGMEHVAFIEVRLERTNEAALAAFNAAAAKIPEIEQLHLMAAGFDYLVKVRTRDMASYRHVLAEKISTLPHVSSTSTFVVMQAIFDDIL